LETSPFINRTVRRLIENENGNIVPEFTKTCLDAANLVGISSDDNKIDYSRVFSVKDKVLCFDDLERANINVVDILGYINNFVEHDNIKTIIICNEKEISNRILNSNLEMNAPATKPHCRDRRAAFRSPSVTVQGNRYGPFPRPSSTTLYGHCRYSFLLIP
jgi:hypothetical protein